MEKNNGLNSNRNPQKDHIKLCWLCWWFVDNRYSTALILNRLEAAVWTF